MKKLYAFSRNGRFIHFQTDETAIQPFERFVVKREPEYDIEYPLKELKNIQVSDKQLTALKILVNNEISRTTINREIYLKFLLELLETLKNSE